MSEQQSPQFDNLGDNVEWIVDQLVGIQSFLEVARSYGFAVTATPKGRAVLNASKHPEVALIRDNICPIEDDPWSRARR